MSSRSESENPENSDSDLGTRTLGRSLHSSRMAQYAGSKWGRSRSNKGLKEGSVSSFLLASESALIAGSKCSSCLVSRLNFNLKPLVATATARTDQYETEGHVTQITVKNQRTLLSLVARRAHNEQRYPGLDHAKGHARSQHEKQNCARRE